MLMKKSASAPCLSSRSFPHSMSLSSSSSPPSTLAAATSVAGTVDVPLWSSNNCHHHHRSSPTVGTPIHHSSRQHDNAIAHNCNVATKAAPIGGIGDFAYNETGMRDAIQTASLYVPLSRTVSCLSDSARGDVSDVHDWAACLASAPDVRCRTEKVEGDVSVSAGIDTEKWARVLRTRRIRDRHRRA